MFEMLKKLKIRYTVTALVIAGTFLFIVFCGIFSLTFGTFEILSTKTLSHTLSSNNTDAPVTSGKRCFWFETINGYAIYNEDIAYYGDLAHEIIHEATEVREGKFSVDKYYFQVLSNKKDDSTYTYALYDRTSDRDVLISTALILSCLYVLSLLFVSLFAYKMADLATKPIEDSWLKQQDLITNASHELKTPLTIIATNLSVLSSEPNSQIKDNEKWIDSIDTQVDRLKGLVQNMLELSKMEQTTIEKEKLNFSQIVQGSLLAFEAICFEKGVSLVSNIADNIFVQGDKESLERLVIILLDNAIKYSGEKGKVGCKLKCDKKITLEILNTGQAITDEEAKHVFDRFYRADGARLNEDNQSFGLGLSIALATAKAHGGDITCRGIENKGTIFEFSLPNYKKPLKSKEIDSTKKESNKKNNNDNSVNS